MDRYVEDKRLCAAPCGRYGECSTLSGDDGARSEWECGCVEVANAAGCKQAWPCSEPPARCRFCRGDETASRCDCV